MKITWLGHAAFRIETGKSIILIDPFLSPSPTFKDAGLTVDGISAGVTHIALTHGHDDHIADAAAIAKAQGATLFAVAELAGYMGSQGVEKLEPMNTGGTVKSDDFALTMVNALHSSASGGTYLGNPCGIVIAASEGKTLLHMGDTEIFSDMALINELHKPDIGIVPIGDRFTMGAKSAALACKRFFNFSTIIPCHFGTFPIIDQTADAFISEMARQPVKVMKVGETIAV